jgi:hypothetical protein
MGQWTKRENCATLRAMAFNPLKLDDLVKAPQAHSVSTFLCANPKCQRVHVVLEDEHENPIAQFVAPDDFGLKLQREQDRAQAMRDEHDRPQ